MTENGTRARRRKEILKGIDAGLDAGVVGLLGANGAGKTTLIRCLTGIYDLDGGKVEYEQVKFLPYRIQSPVLYEKAKQVACKTIGEENIIRPASRGLGGEDFGYLSRQKPCFFTFFGCKPADKDSVPPVHNSKFLLPNESMEAPIRFTIQFVLDNMNGIEGL